MTVLADMKKAASPARRANEQQVDRRLDVIEARLRLLLLLILMGEAVSLVAIGWLH